MPAEYMKPKRNSFSRAQVKLSAAAVKPLITKLYEGTAELRISIPQNRAADLAEGRLGCSPWTFRRRYADEYPAKRENQMAGTDA